MKNGKLIEMEQMELVKVLEKELDIEIEEIYIHDETGDLRIIESLNRNMSNVIEKTEKNMDKMVRSIGKTYLDAMQTIHPISSNNIRKVPFTQILELLPKKTHIKNMEDYIQIVSNSFSGLDELGTFLVKFWNGKMHYTFWFNEIRIPRENIDFELRGIPDDIDGIKTIKPTSNVFDENIRLKALITQYKKHSKRQENKIKHLEKKRKKAASLISSLKHDIKYIHEFYMNSWAYARLENLTKLHEADELIIKKKQGQIVGLANQNKYLKEKVEEAGYQAFRMNSERKVPDWIPVDKNGEDIPNENAKEKVNNMFKGLEDMVKKGIE
jgi:hypothetical protein